MVSDRSADGRTTLRLKILTYTSRAALGLSDRDVSDIYLASRNLNVLDGITGVLVFDGKAFLQIVEGVDDAISSLAERLRNDGRHVDLIVRDERFVEDRSFRGWSMSLVRVSAGYGEAKTEIAPTLPASTTPEVRNLLFRMTDQLAEEAGL